MCRKFGNVSAICHCNQIDRYTLVCMCIASELHSISLLIISILENLPDGSLRLRLNYILCGSLRLKEENAAHKSRNFWIQLGTGWVNYKFWFQHHLNLHGIAPFLTWLHRQNRGVSVDKLNLTSISKDLEDVAVPQQTTALSSSDACQCHMGHMIWLTIICT